MAPADLGRAAISSPFLADDGRMGRLIRDFDWSTTSIGPIETWSRTLRMLE